MYIFPFLPFTFFIYIYVARTLDKSNMIQLLGMLKHGNCSSDFYMFNNTCYSVMPPRDSQRSIVDFHDEISGHCSLLTHATNMNCFTSPQLLGTNFCPVIATPHSPVEAAFMRLLSRTISPTTKSIWVGLKINHTWGSVSNIYIYDNLWKPLKIHDHCHLFLYCCFTFFLFPRVIYYPKIILYKQLKLI